MKVIVILNISQQATVLKSSSKMLTTAHTKAVECTVCKDALVRVECLSPCIFLLIEGAMTCSWWIFPILWTFSLLLYLVVSILCYDPNMQVCSSFVLGYIFCNISLFIRQLNCLLNNTTSFIRILTLFWCFGFVCSPLNFNISIHLLLFSMWFYQDHQENFTML